MVSPRVEAPLRVGVVVNTDVDGGGESYLRTLYPALRERGIESRLLGQVPRWDETGLPSTGLGMGAKWSRRRWASALRALPAERRRALEAVRRQHAATPFALFHAQFKREQVLLTGALSRIAPVVWTEHGRFPDGRGTSVLRAAYRAAARRTATIVCVSEPVRDDIADVCGRTAPPLTVIPNGVDVDRFHPVSPAERDAARRSLGLDGPGPVFATLSRLHPAKGIDLAVEAAGLVDGATLVVAGAGPDRDRLERLAQGRRVVFTGQVERPELVYRSADAFILPSRRLAREGLPLAVLEAAASGLPIAAVAGSGIERQVEAAGGAVSPPDAPSLAEVLRTLLSAGRGASSRRWAEEHDLGRFVDRHVAILTAVSGAAEAQGVREARGALGRRP